MAQPVAQAAALPAQAQTGGLWYTVQPGDTVYSIARRYSTTPQAIAAANSLADPNRIYVGQHLWIPTGVTSPPPATSGLWVTVGPGDTVYSIARRYGSTPQAIAAANSLADPNRIFIGERLWVPTTATPIPGATPAPIATPATPRPTPLPTPANPPSTTGPWTGLFYNNKELTGAPVRVERTPAIDFDWGAGSPPGVPADNFSAQWTSTFPFAAGAYRFLATASDGVRVYVNDQIIIDAWRDQPATGYFRDVRLPGGNHILRVEYYESTGDAVILVWWRPL